MNILRDNKFARDMLTIATIGCILAGLYGAEKRNQEMEQKTAENQQVAVYEVPE